MQTVGLIHTLEQCLNRMQTAGLTHTLEQCLNRMQTVGLIHTLEQCLNRMQTVGLIHTLEQCLNRMSHPAGTLLHVEEQHSSRNRSYWEGVSVGVDGRGRSDCIAAACGRGNGASDGTLNLFTLTPEKGSEVGFRCLKGNVVCHFHVPVYGCSLPRMFSSVRPGRPQGRDGMC
ncbi:hypothetical protein AAFF_G00114420 [Aldrovandia affinis]|uniref:Uncharacterized protein n=1 Tax=Aldrovandia affinis TaxID=143900 RepID=A0AAD7RVF6_9TELE|nr:hypothetical protein AAFF_G00114420 [Aldrovandia affinis]